MDLTQAVLTFAVLVTIASLSGLGAMFFYLRREDVRDERRLP